jgi:Ca2+-binding RTX toxin-like protein
VVEFGTMGHDTIHLGFGDDTVYEAGRATVTGPFGGAKIVGADVSFTTVDGMHVEDAIHGTSTLIGGTYSNEFISGTGVTSMQGGLGPDIFVGGSGHDTMTGGFGTNAFEFIASEAGGKHVITNFITGQDSLYLEGHTLAYLQANNDVSVSGGNTYVALDGGKTIIEIKGVTNLTGSDVTTHKT